MTPQSQCSTVDEIANHLQASGKRTLQIVAPGHPKLNRLQANEPLRRTICTPLVGRTFDCIVTDQDLSPEQDWMLRMRLTGEMKMIYVRS